MGARKPFVEVACICEKVIIEPDNAATLIRLVDKFTAEIPADLAPNAIPAIQLTIFVRLKSGAEARSGSARIKIKQPDGTYGPGNADAKIDFTGPQHGVQFKVEMAIVKPVSGLYWFELYWNESEHLTSVSAEVIVKTVPGSGKPEAGSSSPLPQK